MYSKNFDSKMYRGLLPESLLEKYVPWKLQHNIVFQSLKNACYQSISKLDSLVSMIFWCFENNCLWRLINVCFRQHMKKLLELEQQKEVNVQTQHSIKCD